MTSTARTVTGLLILAFIAAFISAALMIPPCPTEDSVSCVWHGGERGNGTGSSYIVDGEGVMIVRW